MEDLDIEQIKASLLEEQRLETKLKKRPEASDKLLPLLHSLYIARMNLERANWGCSVDRNRFSLLKSSLLEEAHLEELLEQEDNTLNVATQTQLNSKGSLETDLEKLLRIAKGKSDIYKSDLEANLDLTVACPLLPTNETPSTISAKIKQRTEDYLDNKKDAITAAKAVEPAKPTVKEDILKDKEKRRQLVRYIMSSTK